MCLNANLCIKNCLYICVYVNIFIDFPWEHAQLTHKISGLTEGGD